MAGKTNSPLRDFVENQTPLTNNQCKTPDCGGEVVARCVGIFRSQYLFSTPACEACGRAYFQAKNVRKIGIEDFNESLHRSMTI